MPTAHQNRFANRCFGRGFDQNRSFNEPTVRNYLRLGHKSDGLDEGFQTDIQIQAMVEAIQ